MAGVLERLRWPQKWLVAGRGSLAAKTDRRVLELQTAKEILSEIFDVGTSDVEDMIQSRFDETGFKESCCDEETKQWPREFELCE